MAFDDETDDERPGRRGPLPPDDRLWRHPSELNAGTPPPSSWTVPAARPGPRRSVVIAAAASAGLAGAVLAMGVMLMAGPTRTVTRQAALTTALPVTEAAYSAVAINSAALTRRAAPALVHVTAARGDAWIDGTGVWLDDRGTIAVASSIVADATDIKVTDHTGRRRPALIAGSDPVTGITVLKVGDRPDGTATVATAPATDTGEPVAVIATKGPSAAGVASPRVVAGSVSAVGVRTTADDVVLHDAVQLDRAVPADMVGGLALDTDGHLVGIVLSRADDDDLAVLVPASEALAAARDLRDRGQVRRAWLGVRAVDLDPGAAKLLSIDAGARLTQIDQGSPAQAAGLRPGDVITQVDETPIDGASDLVVVLRQWHPGERVTVSWHRGIVQQSADIILGG